MMLNDALYHTLSFTTHGLPETCLRKVYYFHDIRIVFQTNHSALLPLIDRLLGTFPEPPKVQGEATYSVLCYENAEQFPIQLPRQRVRTETLRLLTNTKLKYYRASNGSALYQSYVPLPSVNEAALSVIDPAHATALTQLAMPERYQSTFLRRYVFLLALGQLLHTFGFEPCHAGAISAPRDPQQGALILGPSGSGKTTLSIGCAMLGCGLLGDDLVMLRKQTADGTIAAHAISREVSIRTGSLALWPTLSFLRDVPADKRDKRYTTIERIHPEVACSKAPIRLLLFPTLTKGARSSVTPLNKASTLQELVDQCLGQQHATPYAQEQLFLFLSTLTEQAAGYRIAIARGSNDGPQLVRSLFTGKTL